MIAHKHTVFRVLRQHPDGHWDKDCRVFKKRKEADAEATRWNNTQRCRAYVVVKRPETQ